MFDTHAMVKNLIAAGVPEKQAEVQVTEFARFITYNAATKVDVAEIRRDIEQLRKDTKLEIEKLRGEIKQVELRLTIRLGGIMAVGVGITLAALAIFLSRIPV